MEILIKSSPDEVSVEAFRIVTEELARKPTLALGLATGRTPLGLYRLLREARLDFSKATFFNLDEFVGVTSEDLRSYRHVLVRELLSHVNARPEHIRLLRGDASDLAAECEAYERAIRESGGIDLQILGIGANGHIAFNEPGSSLGSRTRIKTLERSETNLCFCITMGVGTIMEARRILLLAVGREKAEIVRAAIEGSVTAEVPASALQFHPRATVVIDEEAASRLGRREYWRWVAEHKWRVGQ